MTHNPWFIAWVNLMAHSPAAVLFAEWARQIAPYLPVKRQ